MPDEPASYAIHPVATVHRDDNEFPNGDCVIEVRPELKTAMLVIEPGLRLQIMFWMSRLTPDHRHVLQCYPMGNHSQPMRGVFALRSPMRPNPIGSTVVEVKEVRGLNIVVTGLDAYDGTPVVDIKWAMPTGR
jgi:tRNA-Thr(GGU) m(6)t(6)A37 methyltransferase TsaA